MSDCRILPFADGVWTLSYQMKMGPGALLPCRTTILRADDDSLLVISPGPLTDADVQAIRDLGTVSWLIAPNLFHHVHLAAAAEALGAKVAGPRGLSTKQPELELDATLPDAPLPPGLDIVSLEGQKRIREFVFLHKASRTLVATDLLFNLDQPPGFWSRVMFTLFGTYRGAAISRLVRLVTEDADAFRHSVVRVLDLDFDAMIMAHGAPIRDDAKAILRSAAQTRFGPLPAA